MDICWSGVSAVAHGGILPSIDQAHPLFTLLCLPCVLNRIGLLVAYTAYRAGVQREEKTNRSNKQEK